MKKTILQTLILSIIPLSLFFFFYKIAAAEDLSSQLKGRILLQVETHGEAWYINPSDSQKYYLGRPADAFNLMRTLGLGVSNADFAKFNGFASKNLAGKILLKVQDKGQAYYVNPVDLKLNYLGRPADAFAVMRKLGLGISNKDLDKIKTHANSESASQNQGSSTNNNQDNQNNQSNSSQTNGTEQNASTTSTNDIATSTPSTDNATSSQVIAPATNSCEFKGEYFRNTNLIGDANLIMDKEVINFDWGKSKGPTGLGRTNNFSARWTSSCNFDAGKYKFTATFDDGMNVYVDGTEIITSWRDNVLAKTMEKEIDLTAGAHDIKVEYYKLENFGVAKLNWEKVQ